MGSDANHLDFRFHGFTCVILIILAGTTSAESVTELQTTNFCTGDVIDAACPDDWVMHVAGGYFVYVHSVDEVSSDCHVHRNASQQCFRKISFYDSDYYVMINKSCHGKQKCDGSQKAKVGNPHSCWDYPHSPSDYLALSYMCVKEEDINLPTTKAAIISVERLSAATLHSTTVYWPTVPPTTYWIASQRTFSSLSSYFTTLISIPTTQRQSPPSTTTYAHTTSKPISLTTRPFVEASTQVYQTTSHWPILSTTVHHSLSTIQTRVHQTTSKPNILMLVLIPVSVVVSVAAVIAIVSVLICRRSKKKGAVRRRLSDNSSVYYSHSSRNSVGGDSVATRASIHGITNIGYDAQKPKWDIGYSDHVVLSNSSTMDIADIHINSMYKSHSGLNIVDRNDNVYVNVEKKGEPLSEQSYAEVSEHANAFKGKW